MNNQPPMGTLTGIGVGPGDPELITVKAVRVIGTTPHLFVPRAKTKEVSMALAIATPYLKPDATIHEIPFPVRSDQKSRDALWQETARSITRLLLENQDVAFLTIGDPLLYSTWIYLHEMVRKTLPEAAIRTISGVNAFSAAAARIPFALGMEKRPLLILPSGDDMAALRTALKGDATIAIMKVGRRLHQIISLIQEENRLAQSVFIAKAGLSGERIETDLTRLATEDPSVGNLSVILVHPHPSK